MLQKTWYERAAAVSSNILILLFSTYVAYTVMPSNHPSIISLFVFKIGFFLACVFIGHIFTTLLIIRPLRVIATRRYLRRHRRRAQQEVQEWEVAKAA